MTQLIPASPQLQNYLMAIDASGLKETSKNTYKSILRRVSGDGVNLSDAHQLRQYAAGDALSQSQKNQLRSAIKHVAQNIQFVAKASATPDNVLTAHAAVMRSEAMREAIQTKRVKGGRKHNWLSAGELERLIGLCGDDVKGRRDRLALLLMGDCGLRRFEAAKAGYTDVTNIEGQPFLHVVGKRDKKRDVPLAPATVEAINWFKAQHGGEYLLKSVHKSGEVSDGLTPRALGYIVSSYATAANRTNLAPHDLRRTFAEIRKKAGVSLVTIQAWLGHESLDTTRRYLESPAPADTALTGFINV